MPKYEVGDYVGVRRGHSYAGRILAITATEYAVAVPGEGVVWILKSEAMYP